MTSTSVEIKLAFWQVCAVCLSSQWGVRADHLMDPHLLLPLPADPQGKLALHFAHHPLQNQVAVLGCALFAACLQWLLHIMSHIFEIKSILSLPLADMSQLDAASWLPSCTHIYVSSSVMHQEIMTKSSMMIVPVDRPQISVRHCHCLYSSSVDSCKEPTTGHRLSRAPRSLPYERDYCFYMHVIVLTGRCLSAALFCQLSI